VCSRHLEHLSNAEPLQYWQHDILAHPTPTREGEDKGKGVERRGDRKEGD